jgi:hypothetical protein
MRKAIRSTDIKTRTLAAVIAAALALGAASTATAQGKGHGKDKGAEAAAEQTDQAKSKDKGHANKGHADKGNDKGAAKAGPHNVLSEDAKMRDAQRQAIQSDQHSAQRSAQRHNENAVRQQQQAASVARHHEQIRERQADKRISQDIKHAQKDQAKASRRLAEAEQRQLITQQQARLVQYRQLMDSRRAASMQYAQALEQQRRLQQARYAQDYTQRLWQQQQTYRSASMDYNNDPYFYSAPTYQYSALGRTYQTNEYGAELLRRAINTGYQEGLRAGRADQLDNWQPNYRTTPAYQQPYYGYSGQYLDQDQYGYYFRQGVQRGYEDGYYNRQQYGNITNGTASIISTLLSSILNMRSF